MADLLPSSPDPSVEDGGEPRVIGVDSEDAEDLLSALQSETAREVLGALYDDPATPSALAEAADTSIQNVRYHLDKLADADLVEVADTVYSEKGREMNVYAPADRPLVVVAGDDETGGIRTALASLLAGVGLLGVIGAIINAVSGRGFLGTEPETATGGDAGGGLTAMDAATPTPTAGGAAPIDPTAPGALFFFGGLTVLIAAVLVVRFRR